MKKSAVLLLAAILFCLCGCTAESAVAPAKDYESMTLEELRQELTTVTDGFLTVATSPDFAPYEFYALGDDGEPTLAGFDMELAQYIADYLGLELAVVPMDFDGTIMELAAKKADLGMAGYSPDPERLEKMDFSQVYYTSSQSFVTVQDKLSQFPNLSSANASGYQIGAQLGTIQADLAQLHTPEADIVTLSKVTDIVAELLSGTLDGAYIETPVAQAYAARYPELVVALEIPYDASGSVIGVCKGNAPLLVGVNRAIEAAKADGSLDSYIAAATELASGDIQLGVLEEETSLISLQGFEKTLRYWKMFVQGLVCTLSLSALTVLFGFLLAGLLAWGRMSRCKLFRIASGIYVEVFRATPMLVQLFLVYYLLFANIDLPTFQIFGFIRFERFVPGVVALSLNSSAYLCEIIRGGISSVDRGQTEAARSLGLGSWQTMRCVVLPQAMKRILPAIANEFVTIIKESSICYSIGVQEIMSAVMNVKAATFSVAEPLLIAAAVYFCLTWPTSKIIGYFERKMSRGDK